jgi:hypothetical protein
MTTRGGAVQLARHPAGLLEPLDFPLAALPGDSGAVTPERDDRHLAHAQKRSRCVRLPRLRLGGRRFGAVARHLLARPTSSQQLVCLLPHPVDAFTRAFETLRVYGRVNPGTRDSQPGC